MKTLLSVIIISVLISCKNETRQVSKQVIAKSDSSISVAQDSIHEPDSLEILGKLSPYAYDSSIYDTYIPQELKNYLAANLKSWRLANPNEWDNLWFQSYKGPNSLVDFISGDFNCDQYKDYALLLSSKVDSSIAAWIIQSGPDGFTNVKLDEYSKDEDHIQLGLELIESGVLNYIDPALDDPQTIKLKCPAVQLVYFEKAATTYYWNDGKYNAVQTGD